MQNVRLVRFVHWKNLRTRLAEERVGTRNLMGFPMSQEEVGRLSILVDTHRHGAYLRDIFGALENGLRVVDLGRSWALVGPRREVEDVLNEVRASSVLDT